MKKYKHFGLIVAGLGAGAVNGLFGAGGGMILVPLLGYLTTLEEKEIFNSSIVIILPLCLVSILSDAINGTFLLGKALPYLLGSAAGGLAAGFFGQKIPVKWMHRALGLLIVWGGIRYLC